VSSQSFNHWLRLLSQGQDKPLLRLFCFPHAGGSAYAYRSWSRHLPPEIELVGVEPPGRFERIREPGYRDATALVADLLDNSNSLFDSPFAVFGHSMGALLAFELSCQLRARKLRAPSHLFLCGRSAPHRVSRGPALHLLDDDSLWSSACARGGIPVSIQRDVAFQRLYLPLFRCDMELVETYDAAGRPQLDVPITAIGGSDDEDPTADQLAEWASYSSATFQQRSFPGGHFFLRSEEAQLVRFIALALQENGVNDVAGA